MGASRLVGAVGAVFTDFGAFTLFGLILSSVALLSYYGLWQMRRWSVILFLIVWIVTAALQSFVYTAPTFFEHVRYWLTLGVLPVYLIVVVPHWPSMRTGLWDRESQMAG